MLILPKAYIGYVLYDYGYADHIRAQWGRLGTNSYRICTEVIWLLLKYSTYCVSIPSLRRESIDSLIERSFHMVQNGPPFLAVRLSIKCPHPYSGKFVWGEFYTFRMKLHRDVLLSCSTVDEFLPAFIGCLESHDYNIVMAAVGSIPDLVLLCKGISSILSLKQTFDIRAAAGNWGLPLLSSHVSMHTHVHTAKDARALLKQLFLLTTQFRYNCTSELIRAIEACTQHTIRW